jgi:mono/diheme cytochrome c family protein
MGFMINQALLMYRNVSFLLIIALCAGFMTPVSSQDEKEPEPGPEFTDEFLNDTEKQAVGEQLWQQQCRHCHGYSAYPGKAPKLKPRRYKPDFVYDRITNGFRKMPAWKDVYSQEERMSLVAYVLGDSFSP